MRKYDIYLPLKYNSGEPIESEKISAISKKPNKLITFTRTKDGQSETVQMAWREYSPELAVEKTFGHWEKRGYRCEGPQSVSLIEGSVA